MGRRSRSAWEEERRLFCLPGSAHILKGGRTALSARRMRRSKEAEAWREGGEDGWRCPSACRRTR